MAITKMKAIELVNKFGWQLIGTTTKVVRNKEIVLGVIGKHSYYGFRKAYYKIEEI